LPELIKCAEFQLRGQLYPGGDLLGRVELALARRGELSSNKSPGGELD
jgi:hypothetical protein